MQSLYAQYPPERIVPVNILKKGDLAQRIASYSWLAVKEENKHYTAILIGDLRHQWMQDLACSIKSNNIYLVDDGAVTVLLYNFVLKPADFTIPISMTVSSPERQEMARQLKLSLGMEVKNKKIEVFSIYPLGGDKVLTNTLSVLRNAFPPNVRMNKEWHFIGAPVSEKGLLSEQRYFDLLADAMANYKGYGRAVYFSHRAEDISGKQGMLAELGFSVEVNNAPYELILTQQGRRPKAVVGMHSTSLTNVKILFQGKVPVTCYRIPEADLEALKSQNVMTNLYSLYDALMCFYSKLPELGINSKVLADQDCPQLAQ
ncbi:hypothetical protein [Lacimicrobium alkaliphilum]|uniref:Uncharacterized protein n=1 Tax=Lacimicrobium alkaliphilum TaxID=1526571 RepID=A0ABQ1RJE0_9ALTE|nr:hypothetical protein [Lacimicrobium alkaliphilum]GGD72510.1 hypothetical protein GCM10011357_29400 [Lacimicrobium alkaliphilum]